MFTCVSLLRHTFNLRDYGTARWEGGKPDCDHKGKSEKRNAEAQANLIGKIGSLRDGAAGIDWVCTKCGAKRIDQQIGLEPTVDAYIQKLVAVFRALRRVLRDDGTFWLNIGDSYNASGRQTNGTPDKRGKTAAADAGARATSTNLGAKQLLGIPWRLAFALQADGWILRSDIIWNKPSVMPESVTDRCTKAHEYIFMFAKQPRYFFDGVAIKEKIGSISICKGTSNKKLEDSTAAKSAYCMSTGPNNGFGRDIITNGANKRSVWTVPPGNTKFKHFATYPPKLILPCILAGTSAKGCCPACNAPYARQTNRNRVATRPGNDTKTTAVADLIKGNRDPQRHVTNMQTTGWAATCNCNAGPPVPCTVLDPFAGSFTTGLVATQRGRHAIGIELKPDYFKFIKMRLTQAQHKKGFGIIK